MAYSFWRFNCPRELMERYAGALEIRAKDLRAAAAEADDEMRRFNTALDAEFAAGAGAVLRQLIANDGEIDPLAFTEQVMARSGGGL